MNQLLNILREEFVEKLGAIATIIHREIVYQTLSNKISVIIGMRRSGKTTFVYEQIIKLLKSGVALSQILFLNFEDDRLLAPDYSILVGLVDEFYTLYPENHDRQCYLFFDEIQNVKDWPIVIRRFFDTKKVAITLTGSSAKLLSKEINTRLRGRSLSTEIWPFSFHEFLNGKNEPLPSDNMGKKSYDNYYHQLKNYLLLGGFPETLNIPYDTHRQILQDYVNVVVMRDIVERYNVTNVTLIRYMIQSLLKSISSPFSVNKFYNDLKSQGIATSKNTIYEYLQYIEDAYLIFTVPIFTDSIRKQQVNPKKIYSIDMGLMNAYVLNLTPNDGRLFENLIYLDLRRKNHNIFYYTTNEGYEIDFVSQDPRGKITLWQVAWDTHNKETLEREKRALISAQNELNVEGVIITPKNYLQYLNKM